MDKMSGRNRREFLIATLAAAISLSAPRRMIAGIHGPNLPLHGNPILPSRGVCDPQIRVFNGRVYLYATHDASPTNSTYRMNDWWVWSSDDLVHWEQGSVLKPEQTFLNKAFSDCWATDAATRNGQYYFYFSAGPKQIGVVTGTTPLGPWRDPLGKPLIPEGLTPTEQRDPGLLMDEDGNTYIIFGTWDYYMARLNDNMISLAEAPRLVAINNPEGPYGKGKTDDKPFLHQRAGKYYLSWGCFYAMADTPYGPYTYKGSIIQPETTAPLFRNSHLSMDRHGSFFELNAQWYYACNDYSQPGTSAYFRDSVLCYLHYRDNGELAPVRLDSIGVGQYDAAAGPIQAADYFKLVGGTIRERPRNRFEVRGLTEGSLLLYPNVRNIPSEAKLVVQLSNGGASKGRLEIHSHSIHSNGPEGKIIGSAVIPSTGSWDHYLSIEIPLHSNRSTLDLAFIFKGESGEFARLDSWNIVDRQAGPISPAVSIIDHNPKQRSA